MAAVPLTDEEIYIKLDSIDKTTMKCAGALKSSLPLFIHAGANFYDHQIKLIENLNQEGNLLIVQFACTSADCNFSLFR